MIFETHAHYDDDRFDEDREELLGSMTEAGVGTIVNIGASMDSSKTSLELAKKYDSVYAAIGVHPSDIDCLDEDAMNWLREHAKDDKVVAIGEIGLDYYWDKEEDVQQAQREWFRRQLELAATVDLPVVIHSRDAAEHTMTILKEYQEKHPDITSPGVIHCYSYSKEIAQEYVKMGYYIGVGGVVTFKNAKKLVETVKEIPLEKIVLETDCPYMAPEPHRGERNSSIYLKHVANKIAELKGVSYEKVISVTESNAKRLYRFI